MPVRVETSEQTKSRLEELRSRIERETGEEITRQQLLDDLIDRAVESEAEFVEWLQDEASDRPDGEAEG